ncbi:hypothetical protein [Homoserinimonas sp. A520]
MFEQVHNPQHPQAQESDDHPSLTIAGWYALTQIQAWGLLVWHPRQDKKTALVILNDPARTSLNPRTVNLLIAACVLTEVEGTLVVTDTGIAALNDRPQVKARMRATGVI